jgi:DNA-binding MarR family transcriptional regulator
MTDIARAARTISTECFAMRLRQASRALTKMYDDALRPTGILISQLTVLVAVARFGEDGASIHALADVLVMDRTTLSRNLRPLERMGLVRVARVPTDARMRLVLLTREGERAIESAYPLWQRAQQEVRRAAGTSDARDVRDGAGHLIAALGRAGEAAAGPATTTARRPGPAR